MQAHSCMCVCGVQECVMCVLCMFAKEMVCAFDKCIQGETNTALTLQHAQPKSWQEEHQ